MTTNQSESSHMKNLLRTLPQEGRLCWIGARSEKRGAIIAVSEAQIAETGLVGDHYRGKTNGKRHITLIQQEHLNAIAAYLGEDDAIAPERLRRNLVVAGINLLALSNRLFLLGDQVILEGTGLCHPCSRMEQMLGPGGYNAMRGHGGITARVVQAGIIRTGDRVRIYQPAYLR